MDRELTHASSVSDRPAQWTPRPGPGVVSHPHGLAESGFSLMEAIIATVIAVIAVVGLAYTFGVGRGQVDRYEVARAGLGVAKSQMESLVLLSQVRPASDSLLVGYRSPATPFVYAGATLGSSRWQVDGYDSPSLPGTVNLRRATVTVSWRGGSLTDSLQIDRLFPLP